MEKLTEMIQAIAPLLPIFLSVPLIQAIVKMFREFGIPDRFIPFIAIIIGTVLGTVVAFVATILTSYDPRILYIYGVFLGIQSGAGAVGFYEASKYTGVATGDSTDNTEDAE